MSEISHFSTNKDNGYIRILLSHKTSNLIQLYIIVSIGFLLLLSFIQKHPLANVSESNRKHFRTTTHPLNYPHSFKKESSDKEVFIYLFPLKFAL